jgi:glycosyltransferase involved in cell wall biosynthesis
MAPYAIQAARAAPVHHRPALVLDQHNAVMQIPRRLAESEENPVKRAILRLEDHKLRRYEPRLCTEFDRVVWVAEEDRQAVRAVAREPLDESRMSTIIPICVAPGDTPPLQRASKPSRVTFLGGLHWPPNAEGIAWFTKHVWPRVQQRCPEAILTIIGKDPPAHLSSLAGPGRVQITGYVDDPTPYLRETGVFIVPLLSGGGMRVKIIDAWCWELPVVTTHIGAEGISAIHGENSLLGDTTDELSRAVVQLLEDRTYGDAIARGGRKSVEREYDWSKTYGSWLDVYSHLGSRTGNDVKSAEARGNA